MKKGDLVEEDTYVRPPFCFSIRLINDIFNNQYENPNNKQKFPIIKSLPSPTKFTLFLFFRLLVKLMDLSQMSKKVVYAAIAK